MTKRGAQTPTSKWIDFDNDYDSEWRTSNETVDEIEQILNRSDLSNQDRSYVKEELNWLVASNPQEKFILRYRDADLNDRAITLSESGLDRVLQQIENGYLDVSDLPGSDAIEEFMLGWISDIKLERLPLKFRRSNDGRFFAFVNKSKFDLSRYQIFNKTQNALLKDPDHCLYKTFKESGLLNNQELEEIKLKIAGTHCPKRFIKEISSTYNICTHLSEYQVNSNKTRVTKDCAKSKKCLDKVLNIALYKNHFFINDIIEIHNFGATHWNQDFEIEKLKTMKEFINAANDFNYIRHSKIYKKTALSIIDTLFRNDAFEPMTKNDLEKFASNDASVIKLTDIAYPPLIKDLSIKDIVLSEAKNLELDVNPVRKLGSWKENFDYIVGADFEADTGYDKTTAEKVINHKAYCLSYSIIHQDKIDCTSFRSSESAAPPPPPFEPKVINIKGQDCGRQFLNVLAKLIPSEFRKQANLEKKIKTNCLVYFHNLKYDWQHLFPDLLLKDSIEMGNQMYELQCSYAGVDLTFRDSYKMIPEALAGFKDMFKLNVKKEIYPYDYYSQSLFDNGKNKLISTATNFIRNPDKIQEKKDRLLFKELAKDFKDNDGKFDHWAYAEFYCNQDVRVMLQGLLKFNNLCYEAFKMDSFDYLTISSLADNYFVSRGCFEDVKCLTGASRSFVQRALTGGRVMTKNNETWDLTGEFEDFDGVALYPSSYSRLENIGFPTGHPKILRKTNFNTISKYNHYVVEVKIKSIKNKFDFPMLSYKNKDGIRVWSNEVPDVNIVMSKIALEDLVKYVEIEYEIIRGLYWNEGMNDKCVNVMRDIFEMRLKSKAEKNPIQAVYKLVMNSAYGKTCMKAQKTSIIYKYGQDAFEKYVSKNYNQIDSMTRIPSNRLGLNPETGLYEVKQFCYKIKIFNAIDKHVNRVHCGDLITAMSKRIMNEVSFAAKEANLTLFYCDTDSIHMNVKDISLLKNSFANIYNRELVGKKMGQFHSDFDDSGFMNDKGDPVYVKNVYSKRMVLIAPKVYCDYLEGEGNDGVKYNRYHIRLKGVSTAAVKQVANNKFGGNVCNLYASELKTKFDLTCGGIKPTFDYSNTGVSSKREFIREVEFKKIVNKTE